MAEENATERKGIFNRISLGTYTADDKRHAIIGAAFVVAGYAGLFALSRLDTGTAGSFASDVMLSPPGWREGSMHVMFALLTGTLGAAAGAAYDRITGRKNEAPAPKP